MEVAVESIPWRSLVPVSNLIHDDDVVAMELAKQATKQATKQARSAHAES